MVLPVVHQLTTEPWEKINIVNTGRHRDLSTSGFINDPINDLYFTGQLPELVTRSPFVLSNKGLVEDVVTSFVLTTGVCNCWAR